MNFQHPLKAGERDGAGNKIWEAIRNDSRGREGRVVEVLRIGQ